MVISIGNKEEHRQDGYDDYCMIRIGKMALNASDPYEADNAPCDCAAYLAHEAYGAWSESITSRRAMASVAQLIPTTTNQLQSVQ
jgi:hypothetical protein